MGAEHCIVGPGTQLPDWQLSPTVHMFPSLQVVLFATATQAPVAIEQLLQVPQAAPLFCQAPLASHCWGWLLLQVFPPGVQTPVQVPLAAAQTYGHGTPLFCQVPVASQVCGCRVLQRAAPGVQVPVQVPVAAAQT